MPDLTLGTKFTATGAKEVVSAIDAIREAINALAKNADKVAKITKALKDVGKAGKDAAKETGKVGKEAEDSEKKVSKFSKSLNELKKNLDGISNAGREMASIGKSIVQMAAFPIKEAADFEQGMQNVKAIMSDITEKEFEAMSAEARKMGETTAATATEATQALQFLGQAGLTARESTEALSGTLALAEAGNLSLAQSADISTNVLAGMGFEVSKLGHVVDVMAHAAANSNQNVKELGRAMMIAGPAAKGTNTSLEDMVSVLGGLANAGIKGAQGGHAVKRMLLSLLDPTSKGANQLRELGVATKDSEGKFRGLIPILKDLKDKNIDLAEANRIFGKFTATAAIAAAGASKDISGLQTSLEGAQGAAQKMAETRLDSFWGEITLVKSKIISMMIDAGLPLLDMLKEWTKWFKVALDWIQTSAKYFGDLSPVILGVVGAMGGLLVVLGTATTAFGTLAIAITAIATVMQTSAAVAMTNYAKNMSLVTKSVWLFNTSLGGIKKALVATDVLLLTHSTTWQAFRIAVTGAAAAAALAYAAIGAGLVAIAYHAWKWYEAAEAASQSEKRLIDMSSDLIIKLKEFGETDFSKIDITELTQEGIKNLQTDLQKAKVYWIAMKNVAETKGDQEAIAQATNKLKELQGVLRTVSEQTTLDKPREAITASIAEMEAFKKSAEDAYAKAIESAQKYADKALEFTEKIRQANLTTEQKIAEFRRQGLSEEEKKASRQKEIEETLAKLREASANKDFEMAEKLAKHAESLQVANMQGQEKVTENQINEYERIRAAYTNQVLEPQKQANLDMAKGATDAASIITKQLEAIDKDLTANVKIELSGLEKMETELDAQFQKIEPEIDFSKTKLQGIEETIRGIELEIEKGHFDVPLDINSDAVTSAKNEVIAAGQEMEKLDGKTSTMTVYINKVEKNSAGGLVGRILKLSRGFKLPGYSREDTVPALLTAGERVTNALSTRVWDTVYPGFMSMMNRVKNAGEAMKLVTGVAPKKFAGGGKVGGGSVSPISNEMYVNIGLAGVRSWASKAASLKPGKGFRSAIQSVDEFESKARSAMETVSRPMNVDVDTSKADGKMAETAAKKKRYSDADIAYLKNMGMSATDIYDMIQGKVDDVGAKQKEAGDKDVERTKKSAQASSDMYQGMSDDLNFYAKRADGTDIVIPVSSDSSGAEKDIENFRGKTVDKSWEMKVKANLEDLRAALAEYKKKGTVHKIIGGEWVEVPVNADDEQAKRDIAELTKPETKVVTVVTKKKEAKAAGGFAGEFVSKARQVLKLAAGRILPGYGGGDKIDAVLEAGEGVIPKRRVRQYGRGFIQSIIDGTLESAYPVVKLAQGGIVDNKPSGSSGGDGMLAIKDLGKMDIPVGGKSYSVISKPNILKDLEKALKREALAGAI